MQVRGLVLYIESQVYVQGLVIFLGRMRGIDISDSLLKLVLRLGSVFKKQDLMSYECRVIRKIYL